MGATDADIDAFYDRLDAEAPGWRRAETASPEARAVLERTWELIFDTGAWSAMPHWQATVAELRITDVTAAVILTVPTAGTRRAPGATTPAC
ncbi:hypothetical protein [Actinoplanes palleronii]|uniref:Uncharacterized protein n=1 Tax=Actinoplanes palleronii TaxID=113570 RepID=A0ABQ4BDY1_9ACTN|nr:hypothetical protein [Actinoplanes palleronii]GIE68901.1 hypothetical protein Apa02nite_050090 [Actinoplanes palleronii]